MLRMIYELYDERFPQFTKIIDWGSDKRPLQMDVYIDYQKVKRLAVENEEGTQLNTLGSLFAEFHNHADDFISCFGLALHQIRVHKLKKKKKLIHTRIHNFEQLTLFADIKSNMINQHISVKGVVLKQSSVKLLIKKMQFRCNECSKTLSVSFDKGIFEQPRKCANPACKCFKFTPLKHAVDDVQYQRIRVQEIQEDVRPTHIIDI